MDGNTSTHSEVIQQIVKQNHLTYGLQKASLPELWNELMGKAIAKYMQRGVAQLGSASGLGPGGRRFESCHPDFLSNSLEKERR